MQHDASMARDCWIKLKACCAIIPKLGPHGHPVGEPTPRVPIKSSQRMHDGSNIYRCCARMGRAVAPTVQVQTNMIGHMSTALQRSARCPHNQNALRAFYQPPSSMAKHAVQCGRVPTLHSRTRQQV